MKTLRYKNILWAILLAPLMLCANTDLGNWGGKYTKEKTIKKEFNVNSDALFKVKNSYGNLNITSWNENRVVIEVHIKANGNSEERVQERLNEIDVAFENNSSLVSARTLFGDRNNSWGWSWRKSKKVSIQVNYTIKLPVKNSVSLNNDYGSIYLDRIDGHAKINCDYGKIDIGELRGRNNELRFDYTSRSNFDYINSAEIVADYSGFTIEKAGNLRINADYTNAVINQMENLDYTCDYGSIEVKDVKNVTGNGDYIGVKLGRVHGNVNVTADYGSIKLSEMAPDAGDVNIKSDYTGIKIGYNPDYHFDFEISTEYAGVSGKEAFEINISKEKSTEKYYKGFYGSENSGNLVSIISDYGGITFYQN
ncbi:MULTISPECIES: DUF4097 family beta strand repeat-containing protein [Flavobacteriaceae]|uniref:DUF4097 family beta strand repeat-containing protein n=1 Tax=Flavobacteriaceae TaxID=49546 RepID=UPI0014922FCA|nr:MULTISPECIES: DUF4097 family beta strand repeat-containing protein [Allomuricauda]MDC6367026.1 DUF4097 family beta strand repeat-containing protein [Muricauda sp. AC10]